MNNAAVRLADAQPAETIALEASWLQRIRRCAFRVRLDRRIDAGALPQLASCSPVQSGDTPLSLLIKLMPIAFGRRVVFHRPGNRNTTFDEDWLLRLIYSIRSGDEDSTAFALASRAGPRLRPTMRRLAERTVETLDDRPLELF